MTTQTKPTTVTKKRVLAEVAIAIDMPRHLFWIKELERRALQAELWAKEFEAFVRDHRSQDPVTVVIIRKYEVQCSGCGREWEAVVDDELGDNSGRLMCANCGVSVEADKPKPSNNSDDECTHEMIEMGNCTGCGKEIGTMIEDIVLIRDVIEHCDDGNVKRTTETISVQSRYPGGIPKRGAVGSKFYGEWRVCTPVRDERKT